MPTYAVRYTYDERTDVRDTFRAEHRSYLSALAEHGTLLGSGPFTDGDPGALLVFRAASPEVVVRERVVPVVHRSPIVDAGQDVVGQQGAQEPSHVTTLPPARAG